MLAGRTRIASVLITALVPEEPPNLISAAEYTLTSVPLSQSDGAFCIPPFEITSLDGYAVLLYQSFRTLVAFWIVPNAPL